MKEEPLSQVKCEPVKEMKTESSSSAREVKVEQEESENKGESVVSVKQEEHAPEYPIQKIHSHLKERLRQFSDCWTLKNPELGNVSNLMKKGR